MGMHIGLVYYHYHYYHINIIVIFLLVFFLILNPTGHNSFVCESNISCCSSKFKTKEKHGKKTNKQGKKEEIVRAE